MKKIIPFIIMLVFSNCGNKNADVKTEPVDDSTPTTEETNKNHIPHVKIETDTRAIDTIMSLPEIVALGKEVEEKSKGKNHLSAMSFYTPIELETGVYNVSISEDTGTRLVGIYNFNVYVPEMKIMFDDPITGEELTLDEWRKQSK